MSTGYNGRVMGKLGCAIVCVERDNDMNIISILSGIVDNKILMPDVWYTVKDGKWVEYKD